VVAAVVVVLVAAAVGVALAADRRGVNLFGGGHPRQQQSQGAGGGQQTNGANLPPDEQCTDEIKTNPMWVCLISATLDDRQFVVRYEASFNNESPDIKNGFHLHIYGGDGTNPPDSVMGLQAAEHGVWYDEENQPSVRAADGQNVVKAIGDAEKVCARISDKDEHLVQDRNGGFKTGNCVKIQRK
jgi:hypothetical protein